MATGHRIPNDLYNSAMSASNIVNDPGGTDSFATTNTIKVDIAGGICKLDAGVGTKRKLQSPTTVPEGVEITLLHSATADGGDMDIEYAGVGTTNIELDDRGDWIRLIALSSDGSSSSLLWHTVVKSSGVTVS